MFGYKMSLLKLLALPFGIFLLSSLVYGSWKTPRESLNNRIVVGDYKVYFAIGGRHSIIADRALSRAEEDKLQFRLNALKRQIRSADKIYTQQLNLTLPLQSRRYSHVKKIHWHVMDIGKRNGSAGDAPNTFDYQYFNDTELALILSLTPRWQPPNLTPEHEIFHLYQYGYTFFKNAWFLEGLAASMQNHFGLKRWKTEALPQDPDELKALLKKSYSAGKFWSRLALLCDPGCERSDTACGRRLVLPLFEEFARQDLLAAKARGLNPKNWPEKEQRSLANNAYMLKGLANTLSQQCPVRHSTELSDFIVLLQQNTAI